MAVAGSPWSEGIPKLSPRSTLATQVSCMRDMIAEYRLLGANAVKDVLVLWLGCKPGS